MRQTRLWIIPFRDRIARRIGISAGAVFLLLYLYSVGNIVIALDVDLAAGKSVPSISVVPDWFGKIWKPIAPFVWEPIAAIYLFHPVALFLSVPNLLLALLLGALVGLNLTAAIARARLTTSGIKRGSVRSLAASLPALLTGFTCCVPTVILALGSLAAGSAVAAIAVAPYFLPLAAVFLVLNLAWSTRQFACAVSPSGAPAGYSRAQK